MATGSNFLKLIAVVGVGFSGLLLQPCASIRTKIGEFLPRSSSPESLFSFQVQRVLQVQCHTSALRKCPSFVPMQLCSFKHAGTPSFISLSSQHLPAGNAVCVWQLQPSWIPGFHQSLVSPPYFDNIVTYLKLSSTQKPDFMAPAKRWTVSRCTYLQEPDICQLRGFEES